LADALRSMAALLRSPQDAATNRQRTVEALALADNFEALSLFEMEMLPRQTHLPDLHGIERLAGAAFVATGEPLARDVDAQAVALLGDWLDRAAHATAEGTELPSVAGLPTAPESATAAQVAVSQLRIETAHVAQQSRIQQP
jgi:hypothetical protein